jgi:hypothetical protein
VLQLLTVAIVAVLSRTDSSPDGGVKQWPAPPALPAQKYMLEAPNVIVNLVHSV